jgi:4-aminobutyrate aminotransferase-like enzyme/Ser/Thr protein kinase RdoA (MazF antagonist)
MNDSSFLVPLPTADTRKPDLDVAAALEVAAAHYSPAASARELPSERDQNFLLESPCHARRVLRISSPDTDSRVLALQNAALTRLEGVVEAPWLLPDKNGSQQIEIDRPVGRCPLRLFTWVAGTPLAEVKPHPAALLEDAGALLARVDLALADLDPGFERKLDWNLLEAGATLAERLPFVPAAGRPPLERALSRWQALASRLAALPRQLIHNDGNDWNLLVRYQDGEPRATGLIDFGDIVVAPRVCEVAIAAAYAGLGKGRPEHAAASLLAGYHRVSPLGEEEIALLPDLIAARLAVSLATSAWRRRAGRLDPYLSISEQQAEASLEHLQSRSPALIEAIFRIAAGMEAHRNARRVMAHLRAVGGASASPVDADLRRDPVALIELGIEGAEVAELDDANDPFQLDALCRQLERRIGAQVSAGGYAEPRPVYLTDAFAVPGSDRRERRTIHLGVDLFQPAGRPIFAPLAGKIHSFADNADLGDYGPAILLEHQVPGEDGVQFYSLYGHLSRESLAGKSEGQEVAAGEQIGTLGDVGVNGGWAPHLHFQLMLDLLGRRGEFPGVAAPSEREAWLGLCPDPNLLFGIPDKHLAPVPPSAEELLARRAKTLGRNLSLSYRRPLHIVRGRGAFLIDALGNAYLDTVNNVAHVGHGNPRVLRAARRQAALLNTNTRYLHSGILRYAERLAETLPEPLSVCFLVCSGSEANDLAWRMARAATGRRRALVIGGAYHGHTEATIGLSPYKFEGAGGEGRPDWVDVLPMPDLYRRRNLDPPALSFAAGEEPAAFFAEAILSCGGQIDLPPGYLQSVYAAVRQSGGLCVADEVQTGFGRVGSHFWAFEDQGVVPDIVTMGKPIGNGHPLAAVVTTPEVAAAFANGMEYFNTFGGNPVSCAIGEAVLDAIAEEGLQANAAEMGARLTAGLRELARSHGLIGDVRGRGLFLGVELVEGRESKTPATRQAGYLAERMKERGILMSLDGPANNVLKIKPPLVFSRADAERLLETLDEVLGEDLARP